MAGKTETFAMVSIGHKEKEDEENSNYFVFAYAGMIDAAKLLSPDIKVEWYGPNAWDPVAEANILRSLITKDIAGIAVSAIDKDALTPAINKAVQTGIPVITFDADASDSERLAFAGTNNYQAGYLAGEALARWIKKRGEVAISTMEHASHLDQRVKGFQAGLKKVAPKSKTHIMYNTGDVEIDEAGQVDYRSSRDNYKAMLQTYPKIRGIFATFSSQGTGAALAAEELKLSDKVQILAFDFDEETAKLMENGRIRGTVGQDPYLMGYVSMILAYYARHASSIPTKQEGAWRITALTNFLNAHSDLNKNIAEKITRILSLLKEAANMTPPVPIDTGVEILGTDELLRVLARNFEDMRKSIDSKITDLNEEIQERKAELEFLQHLMSQVMGAAAQLGDTSEKMNQISTRMAVGAEQTSQQMSVASSRSQQMSQQVHDISVSAEEVAANVGEISHNVQEVTKIIMDAVNIANTASTTITSLKEHSQEIGEISKVISGIAQQTKFLALNATIEAARVEEFGQGFKVVAKEVKDLARETADSAENITHKISAVQNSSQEVDQAITELVKIVNQVAEFANSIMAAISQQSHVVNEISHTIADTAQGSTEIAHVITEVTTTAQYSSEQAASVQDEAQKLSSLAKKFHQLVGKVNLQET